MRKTKGRPDPGDDQQEARKKIRWPDPKFHPCASDQLDIPSIRLPIHLQGRLPPLSNRRSCKQRLKSHRR
jgi:hypothetical protein